MESSIVHPLPEPDASPSLLARVGFDDKPSRAAKPLRVILAFLKEAGSAQIDQIPIWGPILKGYVGALQEISEDELNQRVEQLLSIGEQTQEDIELLQAVSNLLVSQQLEQMAQFARLRDELQSLRLNVGSPELAEAAADTALIVYRSRLACEFQNVDRRGIGEGNRAEHVANLPLDDIYVVPRFLPENDIAQSREQALYKALLEDEDLQDDCE